LLWAGVYEFLVQSVVLSLFSFVVVTMKDPVNWLSSRVRTLLKRVDVLEEQIVSHKFMLLRSKPDVCQPFDVPKRGDVAKSLKMKSSVDEYKVAGDVAKSFEVMSPLSHDLMTAANKVMASISKASSVSTDAVASGLLHPDARSGDGTVENVGIRLEGQFKCKDCRQRFIHQKYLDLHWKFTHDPNCHQEEEVFAQLFVQHSADVQKVQALADSDVHFDAQSDVQCGDGDVDEPSPPMFVAAHSNDHFAAQALTTNAVAAHSNVPSDVLATIAACLDASDRYWAEEILCSMEDEKIFCMQTHCKSLALHRLEIWIEDHIMESGLSDEEYEKFMYDDCHDPIDAG
jgi:hypothetical protein